MPLSGTQSTIPVLERAKTVHASDRVANVIIITCYIVMLKTWIRIIKTSPATKHKKIHVMMNQ
jgi:hypothetical protein